MANSLESRPNEDVIVLFDGECNLCSGAVQQFIRLDPEARLRFASLQSERGHFLRRTLGIDNSVDSIVTVRNGRAHTHSAALIEIGLALGGWKSACARVGSVVPPPLRDALYRLLARNRFRLFGRADSCLLPSPALASRFIHDS